MSDLLAALVLALVFVPLLPIAAAMVLARHLWSPSLSLRERAGLALRDALVSSCIGVIAGNRLFGWAWSGDLLALLFGGALLLIALPSGVWLWLYWRRGFGA